jgi:hypothetical protein
MRIKRIVRELKINFREEENIRKKGLDKKKEIKLEIKFDVDAFILNCIERKDIFGDKEGNKK